MYGGKKDMNITLILIWGNWLW